ncbi:CocE/NonD family hydrolase [Mesorhizobium sp. M0088]|uniref:CocE/NonD family hydrolase n=1 Tax=Mesorhizobium sp. M0088 TaxID=2956873 RepID=UPI00333991DB
MTATAEVEVRDHVLIKMSDGVQLSARIWLPKVDQPLPALLEYEPYRKGDSPYRNADGTMRMTHHAWYAAHGYGSVLVDIRGTGDSDGLTSDEYSLQERSDAVEVINWLAAQPWCNGRVGMIGLSYAGVNSLQIAALAPESLKAIVTIHSSDDNYGTDSHYFGGAVCGEAIDWGTWQLAHWATPPDSDRVGPGWKEQWLQRLHGLRPFLSTWLSHQTRDNYWQDGRGVRDNYGAIKAAVLAVGGFNDRFRDTVFRLVEHLSGPVKGIVGPWEHEWPDEADKVGPAIGFLQETLRWWDRYLKDMPTGVEDDPALRVYIQDAAPPATSYPMREGRWVTEPSWPSPNVTTRTMRLDDMFCRDAVGVDVVPIDTPEHCGIDGGAYMPGHSLADLPPDQREEDGRSVCFDTEPLAQAITVLGMPAGKLRVHADGAAANLIVRLCDVAPDGASTLVTRGYLNLQRREGMDRTVDLPPGSVVEVTVPMMTTGYVVPAGHRIRLAVSTAYWPLMWPHPVPAKAALDPAGSALVLPVRRADAPSEPVQFELPEHFEPPVPADAAPGALDTSPAKRSADRQVQYNPETKEWRLTTLDPSYNRSSYPDGPLRIERRSRQTSSIRSDDPASAHGVSEYYRRFQRPGWDVEISATGTMRVEDDNFVTEYVLTATLDGEEVHHRRWHDRIPRSRAGKA